MEYFVSGVDEEQVRKEKEKARKLRASQWWKRKRAGGLCHYCGRRVPVRELTMDHIVPVVRGGRSTRGNVVPACKDCNNRKKYLLPLEWEEYLESLREENVP
jgi:5-methylcytosine-specific restriction endonuclease McrA